ncbi:MAG: GSCFA domain-containing protein [Bacteroidales bacterium]|nr:GSCFA domain-containing protein [Candidatus Sodaliphilus fimicaballi]
MNFRTVIKAPENRQMLQHSDQVMLLGSCFSDNIGGKMRTGMMQALVNPFGTIYNPLSIAASVQRLISGEPIAGMTLFQQSGVWNSFAFHSRYSMGDKEATLNRMNSRIEQGHKMLKECKMRVITLGTAVVYRLQSTGEVVSNCHKVPQHEFTRSMASVDEMTDALNHMVDQLHEYNPELQVVFTISPIRHIADGLETNSLSKASLRVTVDNVIKAHKEYTEYFPSYEIVMDDLRDYRFYATDMVHPSDVAVEYIWQTFQATYLDDRAAQAVARCERVMKRIMHRPVSNNSEVVERFNADTRTVVGNLVKEYPYIENIPEIKNLL